MKRGSIANLDRKDIHKKARLPDGSLIRSHTEEATPTQDTSASDTSAEEGALSDDASDGDISASDMSVSDFSADDASIAEGIQLEHASPASTSKGNISVGAISAAGEAISHDDPHREDLQSDISIDEDSATRDDQPKVTSVGVASVNAASAPGVAMITSYENILWAATSSNPTDTNNYNPTSDEQGSSIAYAAYYHQYQRLYQHAYLHPYPYLYPHPYHYLPWDPNTVYTEPSTTAADPRPDFDAKNSGLRTVFVGNLPEGVKIREILDFIRTGIVENAVLLESKHYAFISFVDANAALAFHSQAQKKKIKIQDQELTIGWGKAAPVPPTVAQALEQGATRNVFLGGIDNSFTEDVLLKDFSELGVVDKISIVREKAIAFVHLTHIASAVKAVAVLRSQKPRYSSLRISYGKDRCAKCLDLPAPLSTRLEAMNAQGGSDSSPNGIDMDTLTKEAQRTVYLGNIDPDTTCEHLCNAIRGGILSNIKYQQSKHIAFVTFANPAGAISLFDMVSTGRGLFVKGRKLKVGWGTNAALSLPVEVIQAFRTGATRNVYVGGEQGLVDVDNLRKDFSEYGEIEQVNILKEKNCAFVNFTDVLSAVKAVEGIQSKSEYIGLRISYGKDRCGNPMRERAEGAVSSNDQPLRRRKDTTSSDGKSAGVKSKVKTEKSGSIQPSSTKGNTSKAASKGTVGRKAARKAASKAVKHKAAKVQSAKVESAKGKKK
ncbi:hypothetical protein BGZ70_008514 [Mortierella alpina]|uniref:RRM domain-containing protein n=1 Tax=Mortierella alpina TaxID=64518 RepID=A0A9P6M1F1_MORAP|nr:hypothetical protein BGZ70_008514 [Mortierella alpina]